MNIWRLSCDAQELRRLTPTAVVAAIWGRRVFIRMHRDQKGDDRCWLDDWFVWQLLSDTPPMPHFTAEDGMARCEEFWTYRNARDVDTAPRGFIADPDHWDDDLWRLTDGQLADELLRVQVAIQRHRDDAWRPRTADHDRALYAVLPEGIPADFRLPPREEFLGEARAPHAGCPSFWRSHLMCDSAQCKLHRWGPCGSQGR